jgi:hypothetical protein
MKPLTQEWVEKAEERVAVVPGVSFGKSGGACALPGADPVNASPPESGSQVWYREVD